MNLELRNKEGFYLVSFKGQMADHIFKFLLNEQKLTLTIKRIVGETEPCRVFINNTNETIAGKNELVEFFICPGYYVKILDV